MPRHEAGNRRRAAYAIVSHYIPQGEIAVKSLFGWCLLICSLVLVVGCTSRRALVSPDTPTASAINKSGAVQSTLSSDQSAGDVGKGTEQSIEPTVKSITPTSTSMPKGHGPQVAFRRNGDIWILDINSNRAHQLTSEGQVVSLAWSPDGVHLYYTLYGKGGMVFDYDMSSRQSTRIQIKGVKEIEDFDVSSDGRKFILLHDSGLENMTTTLSLFDVEEKSLSTISSVPGLSTYVRLSPTGSKAAVTICIQGCTLMVYDLSNNSVEEHTELIFGDSVDFFPYGDNLVVESAPWATGFVPCGSSRCSVPEGLYTLNLISGEYSPLVLSQTYNDALFEYPDVSGDGQYIVFQMSELHKESKIAFLSAKSGKVTVLITGERPAWRP